MSTADAPSVPMPDTPPAKGARKPPPKSVPSDTTEQARVSGEPKERKSRTPKLQGQLEELFAMPAMAYGFVGDEYASNLIATRTPQMAEAWYELAQKNPAIKRILERLVEGSAWGGVVGSSLAVLLPLAQHHGIIPGSDPFAFLYPELPAPTGQRSGPIVPPPPTGSAATPPPNRGSGAGTPRGGGTTPPVGVVTVAQSADRSVIVD
jgi:hypothetical protein